MYSKAELEAKAHIELINIAKELGIPRATRLDAQELMYKIIALQSENPKAITKEQEQQKAKESEARPKRARIKPTLLAESSLNNPELHKRKIRPDQNSKPQASGTAQPKRDLPSRPAVHQHCRPRSALHPLHPRCGHSLRSPAPPLCAYSQLRTRASDPELHPRSRRSRSCSRTSSSCRTRQAQTRSPQEGERTRRSLRSPACPGSLRAASARDSRCSRIQSRVARSCSRQR